MAKHWSYDPTDPERHGTYRRKIEDIDRGLNELGIRAMSESAQFIAYFFGCEKLALSVVGINNGIPAEEAYGRHVKIDLPEVKCAVSSLSIPFPVDDLQYLFADYKRNKNPDPVPPPPIRTSARMMRNRVVHDFGPYHVGSLATIPATLIAPKLGQFLACVKDVVAYLEKNWP